MEAKTPIYIKLLKFFFFIKKKKPKAKNPNLLYQNLLFWGVRLEVARHGTQGFKYFPSELYSSAHNLH